MDADKLLSELALWQAAGRRLRLWWRDDDAVADTPALRRLIAIAEAHAMPLSLAVIPAALEASLVEASDHPLVAILQHGYAHRNHAAPGGRAVECGGARDDAAIMAELADGRARLQGRFGSRALPVLTPPWNRIEDRVLHRLHAAGYRGVSGHGERRLPRGSLLIEAHTHLDILRWKGGAHFAGAAKLIGAMADELRLRRERGDDPDEPYGLLTHHLVHDAPAWAFLEQLLAVLAGHPVIAPVDAGTLFGLTSPSAGTMSGLVGGTAA
ncbi:polysaccharide deacetylase family protein [Mangrovicella endophytica]|uniref:polysaccharide deacetylase family protein n=1 Tax=Mangrovicella endophytica TaxID=2066697 RepID=UPI001FE0B3C5|nr:polysaccharide deacetylase family protein [Mangrovicella endophytica]